MSAEATVSVRGEAVLRVAPEVAVVSAGVEVRDQDGRAAVASLAEVCQELDRTIRGYEAAIEELEQAPVTVRPEYREGDPREPVVGYVAGTSFTATVRDFTTLSELVVTLAARDLVTVTGPWWRLRSDSPAYREARLAAAHDASSRARDYAEAYGGRVIRLLQLTDSGMMRGGESAGMRPMAAAAMGGARVPAPAPMPRFDFDPVEQTVYANVEARFAITVPMADL
jgi:uncharacterized protein YggE